MLLHNESTQCFVLLLLFLIDFHFDFCICISQAEINKHLDVGTDFLVRGQLSDALTHYHAAVEGDPNNYIAFFKRGTVYLALGKSKNALSDLDRVLHLKPDFNAARVSRGTVHLKLANYEQAQLDFHDVLSNDPYNVEANEMLHRVEPTVENERLAKYYYAHNDYASAAHALSQVIEVSPWAAHLYELRAEIHMEMGDVTAAVADYKAATRLQSDNTQGYYKVANLLYQLGDVSDALRSIRECLKLDPDHKDCFPFYKKIKKVEKHITDAEKFIEEENFGECVNSAEKAFKSERQVPMVIYETQKLLCQCYMRDEQTEEAISACTDVLNTRQDVNTYCNRAEAYLQAEQYDDAIRDFKAALEIDQGSQQAKDGLRKAQKMQHQSEKRDYYKILGVKRTATKKEITKAYRKAAQQWHPDNYQNDEKMKKVAEKKFIDIAAAKEVLTDDEKRRQFDQGEDPLDPEAGRGGPHDFHQFHHGFHGSPFQFRFHFN